MEHHGVMNRHGERQIPAMVYLCVRTICDKQRSTLRNRLPVSLHSDACIYASGPTLSPDGSHPRHGTHAAALDLILLADYVMALLT